MKKIILSLALISFAGFGFTQDFKMPAPSPSTHIKQDFSTTSIEIAYSRPSVKERKIFGELIPFGKLWRTGANAATQITFNEPIRWGDEIVDPGTYALATIPEEGAWVLLLYKNTKSWGTNDLSDNDLVAKAVAEVTRLPQLKETFEISLQNITNNSADLVLAWEYSQVALNLKADNFKPILEHLQTGLKSDKPPYLDAARFYLDNNYKLEDALEYINLAIKGNPDAFWMHWTKAQILNKLGKKDEARAAARIAVEKTKGTSYENEYLHHYNSLN